MTASDSLPKLLDIVASRFKDLEIECNADTSLTEDLEISSLSFMELLEEVEDEFDVLFPLNNTPQIETLGELAAELDKLRQA